jgi:hypothetical protein
MSKTARHKDGQWSLPTTANGAIESWDLVKVAVLMDLRDELKKLNALLHCHNFVGIPRTLRTIAKQTAKRKYVRKAKT